MKTNKIQIIALYTIVRREFMRMQRLFSQVFLPPIITTLLYFLIFGKVLGEQIGYLKDLDYISFIAPGLIMMAVITNSYANVSSSFFGLIFQKSIEELLVSPTKNWVILLGFTMGGVLRGAIVAILVYGISMFFLSINISHPFLAILVILFAAILFSLAGFTNAIVAKSFDDIAFIPTFVLGPLTYLGGVFYATYMLPPFWQKISYFDPIFHIVNALRYAMTNHTDANIIIALNILCIFIAIFTILNLYLLQKSKNLRA